MTIRQLFFASFVASASCIASSGWASTHGGDPASHIMSYDEFSAAQRQVPYVRHFKSAGGQLCLVGIEHTFDAQSQTTGVIWSAWNNLHPTVAFFEGTDWAMGTSQDVVATYGEPAYLRFMAFVNRVPVTSIEPDLVREIGHLQTSWSDSQIRVFFTLRWMAQRADVDGEAPDAGAVTAFLQAWFPRLSSFASGPATHSELAQAARTILPRQYDLQQPKNSWFDPTNSLTVLNDIARDSGRFRDAAMLDTLLERVKPGERVLLAVGANHVHMLEPALEKILGAAAPIANGDQHCLAKQPD